MSEPVFDDLAALAADRAVAIAVGKHECLSFVQLNADRVRHFARRIGELGRSPANTAIVVINADDEAGAAILELLMPGHDWASIRSTGATPVGRGLVERAGVQDLLEAWEPAEAKRFAAIAGPPILVVHQGVALAVGLDALEAPT